jgi:hypothetical protein
MAVRVLRKGCTRRAAIRPPDVPSISRVLGGCAVHHRDHGDESQHDESCSNGYETTWCVYVLAINTRGELYHNIASSQPDTLV